MDIVNGTTGVQLGRGREEASPAHFWNPKKSAPILEKRP